MPIPLVFGTEHEYVTNATGLKLSLREKLWQEKVMASELLIYFWNEFFPEFTEEPYFLKPPHKEDPPDFDPRGRVLPDQRYFDPVDPLGGVAPDYVPGFMTPLGSRFYVDHGYFESSSPECDDPFLLLACEMAQDEVICEALEKTFGDDPRGPRLYKNVSDGHGHSQAAHRNFCVAAHIWPLLVSNYCNETYRVSNLTRETKLLLTWHVIEQIFTGAGKYSDEALIAGSRLSERELTAARGVFQLSGRADFTGRLVGSETTHSRPIVNQRYEPLADSRKYSRYHCICGDANRAEWPHLFKMGLTAMVLGMIEDEALGIDFYVKEPYSAIKEVSRDPTCKEPVKVMALNGGQGYELSPLQMMNAFLKEMERYISSRPSPAWAGRILEKAIWATWALEHEPRLLGEVLDWKIKELLGQGRANAFNIHLNYQALSGENSLYRKLVRAGAVQTVISREEIEKRKTSPPDTTRAYFRGKFIGRFYKDIDHFNTDWMEIILNIVGERGLRQKVFMPEPLSLTKRDWGTIFEREEALPLEHFKNIFVEHNTKKEKEDGYDRERQRPRESEDH